LISSHDSETKAVSDFPDSLGFQKGINPMFARNVTLHVKPNQSKEVASKIEKEVLPILRKANGFRDLITMSRENDETVGVSLWNTKEEAEAYSKNTFGQVSKILEPLIIGTPEVRSYDVSGSTSHKFIAN